MALKVQINQTPIINTNLKKVDFALVNLEELNNVDSSNLQDGYTLVYDSVTQTWVTQEIQGISGIIDGGSY